MKTNTTLSYYLLSGTLVKVTTLISLLPLYLLQSINAQNTNNKISENNYHYLSTLNTGPSYKYNITAFIGSYLPANSVVFSDNKAYQMNKEAVTMSDHAEELIDMAKHIRIQLRNLSENAKIRQISRTSDSLEILTANFQLESEESEADAYMHQYNVNEKRISYLQNSATYSTDELTLADLLNHEAQIYFNTSVNEYSNATAEKMLYLSQPLMDNTLRDLKSALLKQQCAINVYLSLKNNTSLEVAMKIDSILSPLSHSMTDAGTIIFTVQVGQFNGVVPTDKESKLREIAGLGLIKHELKNGTTVFTVGEYTNYTSADMLSDELIKDGYSESYVVTYAGKGKNAQPFEGIALK